ASTSAFAVSESVAESRTINSSGWPLTPPLLLISSTAAIATRSNDAPTKFSAPDFGATRPMAIGSLTSSSAHPAAHAAPTIATPIQYLRIPYLRRHDHQHTRPALPPRALAPGTGDSGRQTRK